LAVVVGVAVSVEPVVADKPPLADDVHVYVLAPAAVNDTTLPKHTLGVGDAVKVKVGKGFTVKVAVCAVLLQPPDEPVKLYTVVVVVVGVTVGVKVVEPVMPVVGVHA